MKGVILAGGNGTRLYPATQTMVKQLLPIYDKPMIYYPLSIFMLAGIREILIISNKKDIPAFQELFGDGSEIGLSLQYEVQLKPNGIAEAFIIARDFIANSPVSLILGDNIFYGQGLSDLLKTAMNNEDSATIFGYKVSNPTEFGIVNLIDNRIISIEEKPQNPKSNIAVPGLYFYPSDVVSKAIRLEKSKRGELEISSLNQLYLDEGRLNLIRLGRGLAWLDTGTPKSMLLAAEYISIIQERQSTYIACIEEIAYRKGYISFVQLRKLGTRQKDSDYGKYILSISEEDN